MQMYLTKHKIERNWRVADIVPPDRLKILKGHDDHVVSEVFLCLCGKMVSVMHNGFFNCMRRKHIENN